MSVTSAPSAPPAAVFNPSWYPRTYQASIANRVGFVAVMAVMAGLWVIGLASGGGQGHSPQNQSLLSALPVVFFLIVGFLAVWMLRTRVVLQKDAIELRSAQSIRKILRDDIAGWRVLSSQNLSSLELVLHGLEGEKIRFGLSMPVDALFTGWFAGIPDLDQEERARSEEEIASNQALGLTLAQRSEHLAQGKAVAQWMRRISYPILVWGWIFPWPYSLAILTMAALPLVVLALSARTRGLYQVAGQKNDARPSLAVPFMGPCLILALRAVTDLHFLQWKPLLVWAATGALLFAAATAKVELVKTEGRAMLLLVLLFACAYSYGVIAQADTLLDNSAAQVFTAPVLGKRVSSGGKSATWYVRLGPWGPRPEADDVSVPASFFNTVSIGQKTCVTLHKGALKIPWYRVSLCR